MKNLITYIFICFIGLNLIVSLYGWWQSNQEKDISFNEYTEIIDTIWQTNNKIERYTYKNNKTFHISPPIYISKIQNFINAGVKAKPAFQHTYIEIYGYLHKLIGRNYFEDNNKDNDIVRLSNGQLDFTNKLNSLHTCDNNSNNLYFATEQLQHFKEYINTYSPKTEIYFIIRPNKGYGESPYNLNFNNNNKYTTTEFVQDLKALNYHILDLNKNIPNDRHIAFYNTDHHWRVEYAFSQIPIICNFIGIESNIYTNTNYKLINTKRKFTGSLTRRTGNSFTILTDTFKYYKPLFNTDFIADYYTGKKILRRKGTLEQTLLFLEILSVNTWDNNLYRICNQSENPLVRIRNNSIEYNNRKILILADSYSAPIVTYLVLSIKNLDCIDLRSCNNRVLFELIQKEKYDKIILLYPLSHSIDKRMYQFNYN